MLLRTSDFTLPVPGRTGRVRLRTVHTPRFTRWAEIEAEVQDGAVRLPEDALLMAVAFRHGVALERPAVGVLQG